MGKVLTFVLIQQAFGLVRQANRDNLVHNAPNGAFGGMLYLGAIKNGGSIWVLFF